MTSFHQVFNEQEFDCLPIHEPWGWQTAEQTKIKIWTNRHHGRLPSADCPQAQLLTHNAGRTFINWTKILAYVPGLNVIVGIAMIIFVDFYKEELWKSGTFGGLTAWIVRASLAIVTGPLLIIADLIQTIRSTVFFNQYKSYEIDNLFKVNHDHVVPNNYVVECLPHKTTDDANREFDRNFGLVKNVSRESMEMAFFTQGEALFNIARTRCKQRIPPLVEAGKTIARAHARIDDDFNNNRLLPILFEAALMGNNLATQRAIALERYTKSIWERFLKSEIDSNLSAEEQQKELEWTQDIQQIILTGFSNVWTLYDAERAALHEKTVAEIGRCVVLPKEVSSIIFNYGVPQCSEFNRVFDISVFIPGYLTSMSLNSDDMLSNIPDQNAVIVTTLIQKDVFESIGARCYGGWWNNSVAEILKIWSDAQFIPIVPDSSDDLIAMDECIQVVNNQLIQIKRGTNVGKDKISHTGSSFINSVHHTFWQNFS